MNGRFLVPLKSMSPTLAAGAKATAGVALRNTRRDLNKHSDQLKKDGDLTEDENHKLHDAIQKLLKEFEGKLQEVQDKKTAEILET